MKLNLIQKITLSGLLTALTIILTRFLSIQNIPFIPFVRISLGPAIIIFSSLLLGPIFGGTVGGLSDIFGILLVPNALGYGINPWFTLIYTLLGIVPSLLIQLISKIKNDRIMFSLIISFFVTIFIFATLFLFLNQSFTLFGATYTLKIWEKILTISLCLLLSVLTIVGIYFINRTFKKRNNSTTIFSIYQIALTSIISEFLILLIANSIVKTIFFETSFIIIFFSQAIVFFINIALDTFLNNYLLILAKKVLKSKGGLVNG